MESLFDLIAAIHPDMAVRLYEVNYHPVTQEMSVEEFAYFPPRREIEAEWTALFIDFQKDYKDIPATIRLISINQNEDFTLDVTVEFGNDKLNRIYEQ